MDFKIISDRALSMAKAALDGLARRQEVVANNVANIDTPGYRAQSVDFESALKHAMTSLGSVRMETTHTNHLVAKEQRLGFQIRPRTGGSARADGNNVDIDVELMQMAETGIRYLALTQSVSKKLSLLREIASRR